MDLTTLTEAQLTGRLNAYEAEMHAARAEMKRVVTELRRRAEEARLARAAENWTEEELAAMQTIKALGVPSEERFGATTAGGR